MKRLLPRGGSHLGGTASGILAGGSPAPEAAGGGALPGAAASGGGTASSPLLSNPNDLLTAALRDTSQQLNQWRASTQAQADAIAQNTSALQLNTAAQGKGSTAGNILGTASSFLGGGLGALPLVSGLLGLFSGPKSTPVLSRYLAPPSLTIQNGVDAQGNAGPAVYDQYGSPQAATGPAAAPASASANVTVNVQAMDSQSFMDHSFEIAQAVRQAMLNLHSINDVVNEL